MINRNKAYLTDNEQAMRKNQSHTFRSVGRNERFEDKNSLKGSISPDVGRYDPKF